MPVEKLFRVSAALTVSGYDDELTVRESFNGVSAHTLTKNKNRRFKQADR